MFTILLNSPPSVKLLLLIVLIICIVAFINSIDFSLFSKDLNGDNGGSFVTLEHADIPVCRTL
ncbi:hypothetical protein PC119_g9829 [Phytophthora cactorum]|nr:hypothetical protein PC119_g9829 [Phytophthora cactorum]KAG3086382.1 hypothetical protein PC122_g9263 [Phytophthora cactorum]KAG4056299.1 hypothetical protein PC123_g8640 [Phytophthora cactorum]